MVSFRKPARICLWPSAESQVRSCPSARVPGHGSAWPPRRGLLWPVTHRAPSEFGGHGFQRQGTSRSPPAPAQMPDAPPQHHLTLPPNRPDWGGWGDVLCWGLPCVAHAAPCLGPGSRRGCVFRCLLLRCQGAGNGWGRYHKSTRAFGRLAAASPGARVSRPLTRKPAIRSQC